METDKTPGNSYHLTHGEISLIREVIKEGMDKLEIRADERNKRYEDRFKANETAVAAALAAQKEAVAVAFLTSERAILKAETAQTAYNERSNEFRQALDDQTKLQLSRTEAFQGFKTQDDKLEDIKSRVSKIENTIIGWATITPAIENLKEKISLLETSIARIISTTVATEKDISKTVFYIGMALSFLFSLVGMLGMIYSFVKK
jgi:hypothetical protein